MASICTGTFVLAAIGLLKGRRATTHWKSCDELRRLYPEVDVDPDVLYTDDRNVLTSAGVAAGIDLCLHMIRSDHGSEVANTVARRTVVPLAPGRWTGPVHRAAGPRRGSQPDGRRPDLRPAPPGRAADAGGPGPGGVGERTDPRAAVSSQETGLTPMRWLAAQRLHHARRLLERTDEPVDRIAAEAGFGTGTAMRQHFREALGVSPRRAPAPPSAGSE
ncbi:Helix-turn-helix domain-containing protein OS=Streptomyces microflavus OX=1919 GN=G3I39_09540 PE=4 SV=1 [Streptomyces microflavus]